MRTLEISQTWVSLVAQMVKNLSAMQEEEEEVKSLSRVRLFAVLWSTVCQAPLSMDFSRQEYWSGLPCPPPGDLPDPGIRPMSLALQADSLPTVPPGKPCRAFHLLKAFVMCLRINGIRKGMKLCW